MMQARVLNVQPFLKVSKSQRINYKKAPVAELHAYFAEVLPNYDRDRVHDSDIKKLLQWYNIPAPESCHAIAATIREALKAKEEGKEKVILFCLSGHGLIDMPSYDSFINGDLRDYSVSDEEIQHFLKDVPKVD